MDLDNLEISDEVAKQLEESISQLLKQREEKLLESVDTVIAEKLTPQMQVKIMALVEEKEDAFKAKLASQIKSLQERHEKQLQALTEEKDAEISQLKEDIDAYSEYVIQEHDATISSLKESAQKYGEYVLAESSQRIDSYLEYVVEEFIKDKTAQLVESAEYNKMKLIFENVRNTFGGATLQLENNPVIAQMQEKLDESTQMYAKLNEQYVKLKKDFDSAEKTLIKESVFGKYSLTDTQKERVSKLAEQVQFKTTNEFETGLTLIIEEVVSSQDKSKMIVENKVAQMMLNEDTNQRTTVNPLSLDESMKVYIQQCERLS